MLTMMVSDSFSDVVALVGYVLSLSMLSGRGVRASKVRRDINEGNDDSQSSPGSLVSRVKKREEFRTMQRTVA